MNDLSGFSKDKDVVVAKVEFVRIRKCDTDAGHLVNNVTGKTNNPTARHPQLLITMPPSPPGVSEWPRGRNRQVIFPCRKRNVMDSCQQRCTRQPNSTDPNVKYYRMVPVNRLRALPRCHFLLELAQLCCQFGSVLTQFFPQTDISSGESTSEANSTKSQPFNLFRDRPILRWFYHSSLLRWQVCEGHPWGVCWCIPWKQTGSCVVHPSHGRRVL
jgi:hypothetical protein